MIVSIELSYYPLQEAYGPVVGELLARLRERPGLQVAPGGMSTLIVGEYETAFAALREEILYFMERHPSVFAIKISNCCPA